MSSLVRMRSAHFSSAELACHHCGIDKTDDRLVAALEAFRAIVRAPVLVDDAYRCPVHNAQVGGVKGSQHVLGLAADIRVDGLRAVALWRAAVRVPAFTGLGRDDYRAYVHVDVRRAPLAIWCYDAAGRVVPWYPSQR